jgi:hypothetical protein
MTNGITNVVGSQSYNCRLYSRVSLIHSQYNTLHQDVFLEMISIPGGAATTKCTAAFSNFSLYRQLGKKSAATNRFIAQAAFSILLSIDYSPKLTSQSLFALFRATRHM